MTTQTNAKDTRIAGLLAGIEDETMVSLVVRKKGVERGKGGEKKVYGDHLVHVLVWTGWDYPNLVRLSQAYLQKLDKEGRTITNLIRATKRDGHDHVTVGDACIAVQELRESLWKSLRPSAKGADSKRAEWYKPLEVDGKSVRGCKVYRGPDRRGKDPRAPVPGTVYVHGLKLGEVVLERSPNGDYAPKSSGKTIAKDHMKRRLPVGRYVSYALPPEGSHVLSVGAEAIRNAQDDGVSVDPAAVVALFKIAKAANAAPASPDQASLPDGVEPLD